MSAAELWLLVITFFVPEMGQVRDFHVGLFFSRANCEIAAHAIAERALVHEGLVPLAFVCAPGRNT